MLRRWRFAPALLLASGLAGCHLTGALPVDLDPGHGRVDRTFAQGLGNSVRAALDALDELEVAPKALAIRANEQSSDIGPPKWQGQTNGEYLPDDDSFRDLFQLQRLNVEGAGPVPFAPILVSYRGALRDGRDVAVIVRSLPPEARETRVDTRIGRNGDEALSRKLLDAIATRLDRLPKPPAAPPAAPGATPTPAPAGPAATSAPSTSPTTPAPPAGLPPLPPG